MVYKWFVASLVPDVVHFWVLLVDGAGAEDWARSAHFGHSLWKWPTWPHLKHASLPSQYLPKCNMPHLPHGGLPCEPWVTLAYDWDPWVPKFWHILIAPVSGYRCISRWWCQPWLEFVTIPLLSDLMVGYLSPLISELFPDIMSLLISLFHISHQSPDVHITHKHSSPSIFLWPFVQPINMHPHSPLSCQQPYLELSEIAKWT